MEEDKNSKSLYKFLCDAANKGYEYMSDTAKAIGESLYQQGCNLYHTISDAANKGSQYTSDTVNAMRQFIYDHRRGIAVGVVVAGLVVGVTITLFGVRAMIQALKGNFSPADTSSSTQPDVVLDFKDLKYSFDEPKTFETVIDPVPPLNPPKALAPIIPSPENTPDAEDLPFSDEPSTSFWPSIWNFVKYPWDYFRKPTPGLDPEKIDPTIPIKPTSLSDINTSKMSHSTSTFGYIKHYWDYFFASHSNPILESDKVDPKISTPSTQQPDVSSSGTYPLPNSYYIREVIGGAGALLGVGVFQRILSHIIATCKN